jgi:diguanylate cyclase (GGDEF)-like protein
MNQIDTHSKSTYFSVIFSLFFYLLTATNLFAKDINVDDIDEILSLISHKKHSVFDFKEKLVTRLNKTNNDEEKIQLLIQLNVYGMFEDQYDNVKSYNNNLQALAKKTEDTTAMEIAQIYFIVGEIKMQDPANFAQKKLQILLPSLTDQRAKIHYDIAFAMVAIREDFPILENQLLRNTLNKLSEQTNYAFEEFASYSALSAISKDASEYIDLSLQLLRISNKHEYPISATTLLYNLQWHLTGINELQLASRVANKLFSFVKHENNTTSKTQILMMFLDSKVRINESVSVETMAYIKSIKINDKFWQAWLNIVISFYYAAEKDEKQSLFYLSTAKDFFNSQPDLTIPNELLEIESILAFNKGDYIEARAILESFWWKKFLTIKTNQQNNIISVRNTLKKVINEEQDSRMLVEQLLLKSEQANVKLIIVSFIIFILVLFQYNIYLKLKRSKDKLKELSITDGLTNMKNRRYWSDCASKEIDRFKRNQQQKSCLLMLDIDFFKKVNDSFGHVAGDAVIKKVASIIIKEKRSIDIEGRYGGEEFALLLLDCNIQDAINVAERIRVKVEQSIVELNGIVITVTVSIGAAELDENIFTMDNWVDLADTALYQSKENGRNKVNIYQKNSEA